MEVTPIGWIMLPAGPILMVLRPRWLYITTIFFLPFTATELINVGSVTNASGIQASMYLGSLMILRCLYDYVLKGAIPFPRAGRTALIWLGLFTATTALSLIMPLWIDGHIQVASTDLGDLTSTPLYLTSHNITGVLYMLYGFLFAYLIAVLNRNAATLRISVKTFMAGSVFASVWAILELVCKVTGIGYPAIIFNTGTSLSTRGYQERLAENIYRLSSVAVEPSVLAFTLLVALSLYLPFVFGAPALFGKVRDRWFFTLILAVLLLTTSSTGYLGLLIMVLALLVLFGARGILKVRYVAIPLAGLGLILLLSAYVPLVQQVVDLALLTKADTSALERILTVSNSYAMFQKYPVLGIGWASITSHDLIVNILANAGILGLLCFLVAMYTIFRGLYRSIQSRSESLRATGVLSMDFAVFVAIAVVMATSVLSGFLNTFSFFWFLLGLGIACSKLRNNAQQRLHG